MRKSIRYFFRACLRALVTGLFLSVCIFINLNIMMTIQQYVHKENLMELTHIVREEMDLTQWKHAPDLVERVLKRLNHLHHAAIQNVLTIEAKIQEVGGEPKIKVSVIWPKPPPAPEPIPEEDLK